MIHNQKEIINDWCYSVIKCGENRYKEENKNKILTQTNIYCGMKIKK